jgi:hypothetical protein
LCFHINPDFDAVLYYFFVESFLLVCIIQCVGETVATTFFDANLKHAK